MNARILILFLANSCLGIAQGPPVRREGIDHLVPSTGLCAFGHNWDYDVKLRSILMAGLPANPRAFVLVRTAQSRPEYCISLLENKDGGYMIEARQATRHIWSDESNEKNPVEIFRKNIPKEKGDEIANLWEKMLREVKYPSPDVKRRRHLDSGSEYFAAFIPQEGMIAGEFADSTIEGGDMHKMALAIQWMGELCMGYKFYVTDKKAREACEQEIAEQAGADQPASKPADTPPVKDQPSTPTQKDGPR